MQIDLVFVIDSSSSIREANPADGSYDNWELILNFMIGIVSSLNIDPRDGSKVGVVYYADNARNYFNLDRYQSKDQIITAIRDMRQYYIGGRTNTAEGLEFMNDQFREFNGDR